MGSRLGDSDTIFALATPPGRGGISVVRTSGPRAIECARKLAPKLGAVESHRVYFARLVDGEGHPLDEACLTIFAAGRSYTGEETVEYSLHGSPLVVEQVCQELQNIGVRLARPGEFTFRSFVNGRIDLVQAESVLSLIESQSTQVSRLSLRQLEGGLSKRIAAFERDLIGVLAHIEAGIDFSTEDIEVAPSALLRAQLGGAHDGLTTLAQGFDRLRLSRQAFTVAFVGEPNVGKSSLFNRLLDQERSIVSGQPGTTRDFVDAFLHIGGRQVRLVDTAGVRDTQDEIERAGVDRSLEVALQSDLIVYVSDARFPERILEVPGGRGIDHLRVFNKIDLVPNSRVPEEGVLYASAASGLGIPEIFERIQERVRSQNPDTSAAVLSRRQQDSLQSCLESLEVAIEGFDGGVGDDIVSFEIREAIRHLQEMLGKKYDDDILDRVFKDFCLGK
jgi:tRNA modification GTPase